MILSFCPETRSSHERCSVKKGVLRNFAKFEACNFILKETLAQVFSREFCKISKNTFSSEYLRTTASQHRHSQSFRAKLSKKHCVNFGQNCDVKEYLATEIINSPITSKRRLDLAYFIQKFCKASKSHQNFDDRNENYLRHQQMLISANIGFSLRALRPG